VQVDTVIESTNLKIELETNKYLTQNLKNGTYYKFIIQAFNEYVLLDQKTEQVMLTIRDGLTLIRKK
jgi:hypothetical protein